MFRKSYNCILAKLLLYEQKHTGLLLSMSNNAGGIIDVGDNCPVRFCIKWQGHAQIVEHLLENYLRIDATGQY